MARMSNESKRTSWVVCVSNDGCEVSLQPGKLYRRVADSGATAEGLTRVIDDTGEDYLFRAEFFHAIKLSPQLSRALRRVGNRDEG